MKSTFKNNFLCGVHILLALNMNTLQSANIICDLGGVLIETDWRASLRHLGLSQLALYFITTLNSPYTIKHRLYQVMNTIAPYDTLETMVYDNDNLPMPALMVDWLTGTQSNKEILSSIEQAIDASPSLFTNSIEQRLVKSLARMIFNPKHFVKTRKLVDGAELFIKKCKKRGDKVYILSNWDKESFPYLRKKFAFFFNLFDGIIISGEHNCLKPDDSIYQIILSTFGLNPYESVFVDDQKENLSSARQNGIASIHYKKTNAYFQSVPNFDMTFRKLIAWDTTTHADTITV